MNDFGIFWLATAIQVSVVILAGGLIQAVAARRSAMTASWIAAVTLGLVVVLPLVSCMPWQIGLEPAPASGDRVSSPEGSGRSDRAEAGGMDSIDSHQVAPKVPLPTEGRGWSLDRLAGLCTTLGRGAARSLEHARRWGWALAGIASGGIAIGLVRLLLGIWAVHVCRRQGRRVDDPKLSGLAQEIRAALGCRRSAEVRELPDLGSPATAEWWRPLILLPQEWRSWDDFELRAVLAHELAHIRRGDYATGFLARLAMVFHFYHPLVHATAGRMLLQQEFAADAIGARFVGGRNEYRGALSRIALRQTRDPSSWPARAFLPAKGTLIRRIEMLGNAKDQGDRPWAKTGRMAALGFLTAIAIGVVVLRSPARGGGPDSPSKVAVTNETPTGTTQPASLPRFELSYVSDDVMGFVAYRPAAFFQHAGMTPYLEMMKPHVSVFLGEMARESKAAPSTCPLTILDLEQVTHGLILDKIANPGKTHGRLMVKDIMIRTVKSFDWEKQVRQWWPKLARIHAGNTVYYKLLDASRAVGKNPCVYFPDDRTVVETEEENIVRMIQRKGPPEFLRKTRWEEVGNELAAVGLVNDGRLAAFMASGEQGPIDLASLFKGPRSWILGIADDDSLGLKILANCPDTASSAATATMVDSLLQLARAELSKPGEIPPRIDRDRALKSLGLLKQFVSSLRLTRDGTTVTISTSPSLTLTDLVWLLVYGQSGPERPESPPKP